MRSLRASLFSAALCLAAPHAQAWGDDGHRVVGELAFRLLSPQAQAAVQEALTEPGYETLAEAATWADTYARRFPEFDPMKPFHYVNVRPDARAYERERDCPNGCVVTALTQLITLLESHEPPVTLAERRRNIYWVAHFMGDIHQPLHVAHPDGKGGMATLVGFFEVPDKRWAHWVWDFGLIERRPPPPPALADRVKTDQPMYRALADELFAELTPARKRAFRTPTDPAAIANETLPLARRFAFLKAGDHVDKSYQASRWTVVKQQLEKAGVRLAAVLERALGHTAAPATR
jgi:hypothetical protein